MAILDIFDNDAFTTASMTEALDLTETQPSMVGSMNLFTSNPIRTETVAVEKREGALNVIQTSSRGAPLESKGEDKRTLRDLRTSRIAKHIRISASELQFIRQFGEEEAVKTLQVEIARRLNGPTGLVAEVEATWERMRLGSIQGSVLDADDSVIYNFNAEFGTAPPTEVAFDLANTANGDLRKLINAQILRPMRRAGKGLRFTGVVALCGDNFWDELVANAEVRATYLNSVNASDLRDTGQMESFNFGGVKWTNYIGTDDNSKVAIDVDKAKFVPAGASGAFESVWSPGESFAEVGQLGSPIYVKTIPDRDRDSYVDLEVYSYPLMLNKRPDMAFNGRVGA